MRFPNHSSTPGLHMRASRCRLQNSQGRAELGASFRSLVRALGESAGNSPCFAMLLFWPERYQICTNAVLLGFPFPRHMGPDFLLCPFWGHILGPFVIGASREHNNRHTHVHPLFSLQGKHSLQAFGPRHIQLSHTCGPVCSDSSVPDTCGLQFSL